MTSVLDAPSPADSTASPGRAALAGVLAAATALGVSELLGAVRAGDPSLITSVGEAVIDLAPGGVVDAGISVFGTNDKPALVIGILIVAALIGARVGRAAERRPWVGAAVFTAFGLIGWLAVVRDPLANGTAGFVIAALTAAIGWFTLRWLLDALRPSDDGSSTAAAPTVEYPGGRRQFLGRAGLAAGTAVVAPAIGRRLRDRADVAASRDAVQLATATPTETASLDLPVEGISPLYTPNDDFYRIDTALAIPQVDPANWSLRITGEVEEEIEISFDELVEMSVVEEDVTIACVSNEVGGGLIGTARWTGVPISQLLDRARPTANAEQLMGISVDGFTAGFPLELAYDGRPALIAVGMNGEPLPVRHGFPARIIVGGIYGYVSATKWLSSIRLTQWDGVDGYWIPRGWSKEAPIKIQSRIDVPRRNAAIEAGTTAIAGVAWAQPVGVARVEVSIDDGPWQEAELGTELTGNTWRQWMLPWDATSGRHRIAVRATDLAGQVQTDALAAPAPNGATGHHTVDVDVR